MLSTKTNFECWLVSNTPYLKETPFLPTPPLLGGNSKLPPFFGKISKT